MQNKFQLSYNGQEVETDDFNSIADSAALADDRVFAELFRMLPRANAGVSTTKGILGYSQGPILLSDGNTSKIRIYPFRAFVASATFASISPSRNWSDIRSGVVVGGSSIGGPNTLYTTVSFDDNTSGFPRWDLVYLEAIRDNEENAVRYIKVPGTPPSITTTSVPVLVSTKITIQILAGTPGAIPALPSVPTDSGSTFYIPLGYIKIADGYSDAIPSTFATTDIMETAPVMKLSKVTGAVTSGPATAMNDLTGAMMTVVATGSDEWGGTGTRPPAFMPASMSGEDIIYIALNLPGAASSTNWSQPDGSVIDSRDWRNRIFFWDIYVHSTPGTFDEYPWEQTASFPTTMTAHTGSSPVAMVTGASIGYKVNRGAGNSFLETSSGKRSIAFIDSSNCSVLSTESINIYVKSSDGTLRFTTDGSFPDVSIFMRLCASSPYPNK